jgi:outer membrane receptor protein involved in Fe transport
MKLFNFTEYARHNSFLRGVVLLSKSSRKVSIATAVLLFGMLPAFARSQPLNPQSVHGTVVGNTNHLPEAGMTVSLERKNTHAVLEKTVTDEQGRFEFTQVPAGEYSVVYGSDVRQSAPFAVRAGNEAVDLGAIKASKPTLTLDKFEVTGTQREFYNSIDRKIYSVGDEIQSTSGSASDLLQNIPSVQVDIDGNVSLRGSDNVTILIDGRTSTLMGKNRADALLQFPANQIDKIEVITNPSAKYKPDGTAGIINIVLKKKRPGGSSTTVTGNIGPDNRYNSGISTNYGTGKYNVFASYGVRQDDRSRQAGDIRTITDPVSGAATTLDKKTVEHSRPLTQTARATADYHPDKHNKIGATASYNRRTFNRSSTDHNIVTDTTGSIISDYDRTRYDPEYEDSREFAGTYEHTFANADHRLTLQFKSSITDEQEDNRYSNIYHNAPLPTTYDNTRIRPTDHDTEAIVEYVLPIDDHSRLEAGYTRSEERLNTDFAVSSLDPGSGVFINDPTKSNRFDFQQTIHALYLTYARTMGRFGFLAGLRPEQANTKSLLVNTGETIPYDYFRVYPSLHLSRKTSEHQELQLNYSHRVRRPESDDLNPFPKYSDPFTLRAGNPRLRPENIHSIEAGYQYRDNQKTFVATIYHRYLYNGFTNVTRDIGNSVLLTTDENLATSRFTGVELSANTDVGKHVSLNFSSNTYFNSIDASNLGFTGTKSDISWSAKLGATVRLPKDTLLQFNTNYTSTRLTPQGSRRPTYIANLGLRREFMQKRLALVLTISDLFNSLKESTVIDTPLLKEVFTRRRSSRIVYVGFSYSFGQQSQKKDDILKFDESI